MTAAARPYAIRSLNSEVAMQTRKQSAMILFLEVVLVAGIVLGLMACGGYFEPKYACMLKRSQESNVATVVALVLIAGSLLGLMPLNRARKAAIIAPSQTLEVSGGSA
jgi:F0F1-type ATP synthase assembly protein I